MVEVIYLTPATLYGISKKTGVSQAQLEVMMSQANEANEVYAFTVTTEAVAVKIPHDHDLCCGYAVCGHPQDCSYYGKLKRKGM